MSNKPSSDPDSPNYVPIKEGRQCGEISGEERREWEQQLQEEEIDKALEENPDLGKLIEGESVVAEKLRLAENENAQDVSF